MDYNLNYDKNIARETPFEIDYKQYRPKTNTNITGDRMVNQQIGMEITKERVFGKENLMEKQVTKNPNRIREPNINEMNREMKAKLGNIRNERMEKDDQFSKPKIGGFRSELKKPNI
jgi:hypothetical protein